MKVCELLSDTFEIFISISAITESRNGTYCHKTGEGGAGETGKYMKFPDRLRCAAVGAWHCLFLFLLMKAVSLARV